MRVRPARPEDFTAILALGHELHTKSERAHLAFDPKSAREILDRCITRENERAFVAEEKGRVVGFTIGSERRWPYIRGKYVTDLVLFSTYPGAGRALVRALIAWARERKADEVLLAVSFGGKSVAAGPLFERQGMKLAGGMYALKL